MTAATATAAKATLIVVDTTNNSTVVTIPTGFADKDQVEIKHVLRGGTNTVTVNLSGTDKINRSGGVQTLTLAKLGAYVLLQYDATAGLFTILAEGVSPSQAVLDEVNTVAASGAAVTLPDVSVATFHDVTLTAACTFTLPALSAAGSAKSFTLRATQDATGSRTATFTGAKWAGGATPLLSTGAGKSDVLTFFSVNGSPWIGGVVGLDVR